MPIKTGWPRLALAAALVLTGCGGGSTGDAPVLPSAFRIVIAARPIAGAPRVAASPDGTSWVVWSEGDFASQNLVVASVDSGGGFSITTVAQGAGAIRDHRIVMVNTAPVVAWREYLSPTSVSVHSAAWIGGAWRSQLDESASGQGDLALVALGSSEASLAWTRVSADGRFELVSSQRSPVGAWTAPTTVRAGPSGTTLVRSSLAADGQARQALLWSEMPTTDGSVVPPQELWSAQRVVPGNSWDAPVRIEAGRLYFSPVIAPAGTGGWVAAWLDGHLTGADRVLAKRFGAGAWQADTTRLDSDRGETLRELDIAGDSAGAYVAWTSVASDQGSTFASRLDDSTGQWSVPSLLGRSIPGFPDLLRLHGDGRDHAFATWSVSQGPGGPFLEVTDASGFWRSGSALDRDGPGLAADLSTFAADDVVLTWLQGAPLGLYDIVVRRLR